MPASVTLSGLSWSTPDDTPLFTNISLAFGAERTGLVGRNGVGKSTLLGLISGALAPSAGEVAVTGTLGRMRQTAMTSPDDTVADLMGVARALALLDRAEAGHATPADLAEADWTLPARIEAALQRTGLDIPADTPLARLSGGQQSRAALAALILAGPDMLLLDEPTNNLDRAGRDAVIALLDGWRGGAIVVSHDRELLDRMDAIVELTGLGATRYGGNYTAFQALRQAELDAAQRDLAQAERTLADTARRARIAAERKDRKDAAGHRSRARGDQPKMLLDKAKERAEASGGAGARLREARLSEARADLHDARDRIEVLVPVHMQIPSTGLPSGREVLTLRGVTGGQDPAQPVIRNLDLQLTGPERLAVTGPNGSGKTTLLNLVSGHLAPLSGVVELKVPCAVLDQHLAVLDPGATLLDGYRALSPGADRTACHAALARFGFRAADGHRTVGGLSGGERLRAALACTLGRAPAPQLLILDEPTNHLDLGGMQALEAALAGYDGAMIVVSHDPAFLRTVAPDRVLSL